jgi:hypothetical protein
MTEPWPSKIHWDGVIVAPEPPTSRRMVAAKRANGHLLALTERQRGNSRDERLVGFLCECGCMDTATMTVSEYEGAGGAWCAGHKPI